MKTAQIRAEKGQGTRPDASSPRLAGSGENTTAYIDDVLRQIIREELEAEC
jgi:hypothetical protein